MLALIGLRGYYTQENKYESSLIFSFLQIQVLAFALTRTVTFHLCRCRRLIQRQNKMHNMKTYIGLRGNDTTKSASPTTPTLLLSSLDNPFHSDSKSWNPHLLDLMLHEDNHSVLGLDSAIVQAFSEIFRLLRQLTIQG